MALTRTHPTMWLVLLLGLAGPMLARATTLAQLRAQLEGMRGTAALSAEVRLKDNQVSGKKAHPKVVKGAVALHVVDGAQGLDVRVPADVLAKAGTEGAAVSRDPDAPTPTLTALRAVDPVMIHGMADFAPVLLHKLIGATLISQRDVTSDGRTLHAMRFSIPAREPRAVKSTVDDFQGTLTVWLDARGVPVGVHESRHYKGSKFFIHFSFFRDEDYRLGTVGRRLVVRQLRSEQGGLGLGRGSTRTLDIGLAPTLPAVAPAD